MKIKKALAVLLAVVLLVLPLSASSFAAGTILTNPTKTAYNDSEYFNPQGLSFINGTDVVVYSPTDTKFRFEPALNELLTVETTEVAIYYNNEFVATVPVTVKHVLGELTCIDNGHGYYCLGCGALQNFEAHKVDEWIPNDDGGLFIQQTQTGKCTVCDAEVTKSIPNTESFYQIVLGSSALGMTELEAEIWDYVNKILVTLIQMLTGIS